MEPTGERGNVTSGAARGSMRGMDVAHDIEEVRARVAEARAAGRVIGLVPTMGYLHAGHLALVEAAVRDATYVVVSIFVNPTQFGPNEDLERYPRDEAGDLEKCRAAGVELVFVPPVPVMYPADAVTTVHVRQLTETLCGPCRPGHFDGVTTVVAKLFNIVQPDRAYFGEKDAQQLAVLRRMARDLDFSLEVVGCPTVREADGLAMSSRNALLSADERQRALVLHKALQVARERIRNGETRVERVLEEMRRVVDSGQPAKVDYIEMVDPETLQPVGEIHGPVRVALAVWIGRTRLIDNLLVDPEEQSA